MTVKNSEFAFHVHKLRSKDRREDLYTIGVWRGTVLRGICYVQPIDEALCALRQVFEQAESAEPEILALSPRNRASRSLRRRIAMAFASCVAGIIKLVR